MLLVSMGVKDRFLCGMWGLGLMRFYLRRVVFCNLGVEVVRGLFWRSGLRGWLIIVRVWVGGMCYLCREYYKVNDRDMFRVCVCRLVIRCVILFLVAGWLVFFFFFEVTMIPIVFLVLG